MGKRKLIRHGTRAGYDKHYRTRSGSWNWPLDKEEDPCGCAAALSEWQRKNRSPRTKSDNQRSLARQRAYKRLKDAHPGEFARFFAEEVSILQDGGSVVLANLQQDVSRELREADFQELERLVGNGWATLDERKKYSAVKCLKHRIAELEQVIASREPDRDS